MNHKMGSRPIIARDFAGLKVSLNRTRSGGNFVATLDSALHYPVLLNILINNNKGNKFILLEILTS